MYQEIKYHKSLIKRNEAIEGETIEEKIGRIINNKEPIKDGAPIIFTERKEGIISAYNIRADRWEIATDAMDVVSKTNIAKREGKGETKVIPIGETEPTRGTEQSQ